MSVYSLDTNIIIAIVTRRMPSVKARLDDEIAATTKIFVSSIVLFELRFGVSKGKRRAENIRRLDEFFAAPIDIVPFNAEDAEHAGDIRAMLQSRGTPIGAYDILIAAQARRLNATLVTANRREFDRVPGLMVQDWAT